MRRVGHIRVELGAPGSMALTVIEHRSEVAGPAVAVAAGVHGDEVAGVLAARMVDRELPGRLRRGSVVLLPSVNPPAMAACSRVLPRDGSDLNRLFPGSRRGGAGERLAHAVWEELARHELAALVDLHCDSAVSIPYVIADRAVSLARGTRARFDGRLYRLADATGFTVVREYPDEQYLRFGLDHSLAGAMVNRASVPAVTVECGGRRVADTAAAEVAAGAVWNVLAFLGLIDGSPSPHPTRVGGGPWRRAGAVYASMEGLLRPLVPPGRPFEAGVPVAEIGTVDGEVLQTIHAARDGLVVSWCDGAMIGAGAAIGTFAMREA